MRRKDLEVLDMDEKINMMKKCEILHLAFYNGDYPYVIPMNFGFFRDGEKLTLYLHSAREGQKLECMKKNPHVGFQMECFQRDKTKGIHCKTTYDSLCGYGELSIVEQEEEMVLATNCMMDQYEKKRVVKYSAALYRDIYMLRLEVKELIGKAYHG